MKAFVLLLTIAFASRFADVESRMTTQQIQTALKTVRKSCIAKSGATKEAVEATHSGVFDLEDQNLGCFFLCNMGMMKATGKDGKFSFENTKRQSEMMLPEELVERTVAMATKCAKAITSDDACVGAIQYAKCAWETDQQAYFFA